MHAVVHAGVSARARKWQVARCANTASARRCLRDQQLRRACACALVAERAARRGATHTWRGAAHAAAATAAARSGAAHARRSPTHAVHPPFTGGGSPHASARCSGCHLDRRHGAGGRAARRGAPDGPRLRGLRLADLHRRWHIWIHHDHPVCLGRRVDRQLRAWGGRCVCTKGAGWGGGGLPWHGCFPSLYPGKRACVRGCTLQLHCDILSHREVHQDNLI